MLFWLTIFNFTPFTFSQAYPSLFGKHVFVGLVLVLILDLLINQKIKFNRYILFISVPVIIYQFILFYVHDDSSYVGFLFALIMTYIIFCYGLTFIGLSRMANSFIYIMMTMLALSVIGSFLALIGILEPFSTFSNPDGRVAYNYLLTFTNSQTITNGGSFIRAAGFFDEPGALAFFSFYAIVVNELYLKKNKLTAIIALSTVIATWSMGFVIIISLYFLFIKCRKLSGVVMLLLTIAFLLMTFSYLKADSSPMSKRVLRLTIDRVVVNDNGSFQGDNRSHLLYRAAEEFANNPLIGAGRNGLRDGDYAGANVMAPFARDGIVGGLLYFSLYIFLVGIVMLKIRVNKGFISYKEVVLVFLLGVNFLHRPNLDAGFETISMLIVIIVLLQRNKLLHIRNNDECSKQLTENL